MKKKKHILITLVIIGTISWCLPIVNAGTITNLGTVEYMNSLQVDIDSNEELNLTFVSSFMDENDIKVTNYGFNPILNKTRFLFTSEHVTAEWWMKNESIEYIYQDIVTKQLYSLYVDYNSLEIPLSPLEIDLIDLLDEYDVELDNNSELVDLTRNLLIGIVEDLNSKNLSLSEKIDQLEQLTINFYNLSDDYNFTSSELSNMTSFFNKLNASYSKLKSDNAYNFSRIIEIGANLSKYKNFYEGITISHDDSIWFDGDRYTTNQGFQRQIKKLKDDTEIGSLILIMGIIITIVFCFLIARVFIKQRNLSPEQLADKYGYPSEAGEIDDFASGEPLHKKTLKEKIPFIGKKSAKNQIQEVEQKMDVKIQDINQKVDTLIDGFDSFKTNIYDDLTKLIDKAIAKPTVKK